MQETRAPSLGQENPLEKEMATHPSVLAWRIPGMVEPGGLPSMGSHRVGLKRLGSSSRYGDDAILMAESEEELKSLLMKVKEESEKPNSKLHIQKSKIMASSFITSWQIDGEKWKQWQTIFSWAPKITADGDCNHEIKRSFLGEKL